VRVLDSHMVSPAHSMRAALADHDH
jgi:hypothetical protein